MEYYSPRQFVECLLPEHYDVQETWTGNIRCCSDIGIDDEAEWERIHDGIINHFGESLKEVYLFTWHSYLRFNIIYNYHTYTPQSSTT